MHVDKLDRLVDAAFYEKMSNNGARSRVAVSAQSIGTGERANPTWMKVWDVSNWRGLAPADRYDPGWAGLPGHLSPPRSFGVPAQRCLPANIQLRRTNPHRAIGGRVTGPYSRLIGLDEEGTLQALKDVQAEAIAPHIAESDS